MNQRQIEKEWIKITPSRETEKDIREILTGMSFFLQVFLHYSVLLHYEIAGFVRFCGLM